MEKNHVEAMRRNERFNQAARRWKVFEQLTSKRLIYCRHSVFEKYADALRWKNAQHKLLLQDDFHKSRHLQSQKKYSLSWVEINKNIVECLKANSCFAVCQWLHSPRIFTSLCQRCNSFIYMCVCVFVARKSQRNLLHLHMH